MLCMKPPSNISEIATGKSRTNMRRNSPTSSKIGPNAAESSIGAKPFLSRSQDNISSRRKPTGVESNHRRPETSMGLQKSGSVNVATGPTGKIHAKLTSNPLRDEMIGATNMTKSASSNCIEASGNHFGNKENVAKTTTTPRRYNHSTTTTTPADVRITKTKSTVTELQKQKNSLEAQVSDLVKNAELKQAEIASLHFELSHIREENKEQLGRLVKENEILRHKLTDLGHSDIGAQPTGVTTLLSVQTADYSYGSGKSADAATSPIVVDRSRANLLTSRDSSDDQVEDQCGNLRLTDEVVTTTSTGGDATGRGLVGDWDRQSLSSMSEVSMACLQDRIEQMVDTHEELQATLQELTDLQDTVNELANEKSMLLESLCNQTDKLENSRLQIENLKHLLLSGTDFRSNRSHSADNKSEREHQLVDLLKTTHEEHEELMCKYLEVRSALRASDEENQERHEMMTVLRDRARLLEVQVENLIEERNASENRNAELSHQGGKDKRQIGRLQSLLEKEKSKAEELQKCSDTTNQSEVEKILDQVRREKDQLQEKLMSLEESLAQKTHEINRSRQMVASLEEEVKSSHSTTGKTVEAYEGRIEELEKENDMLKKQNLELRASLIELDERCQRYAEDKKELRSNILQLQKAVDEVSTQRDSLKRELGDLQSQRDLENEEWRQFQADLQVAVVVANDFKMEAQTDIERLQDDNTQLKDRLAAVQAELDKIRSAPKLVVTPQKSRPIPTLSSSFTSASPDQPRMDGYLGIARQHKGTNSANNLSVKALIESLESAGTTGGSSVGVSRNPPSLSSSLMRSPGSSHRSIVSSGVGQSASRSIGESFAAGCKSATQLATVPNCRPVSMDSAEALAAPLKPAASETEMQSLGGSIKSSPQRFSLQSSTMTTASRSSAVDDSASTGVIKSSADSRSNKGILVNKAPVAPRKSVLCDPDSKDPLYKLMKDAPRGSRRNALLKWCQGRISNYKNVDITNFSSSWNDGLAFAAMMHSYLPDKIPIATLDSRDKRKNFSVAFDAAEQAGIPRLLSVDEMVALERPDWQIIMNYVTLIFKCFEA